MYIYVGYVCVCFCEYECISNIIIVQEVQPIRIHLHFCVNEHLFLCETHRF